MDLPFALEGFFFEKVNGSTGQRVTFTFHYIIYAPASRHTAAKRAFCFAATASKSLIRAKGAFCCTASRRTASRRVIFPSHNKLYYLQINLNFVMQKEPKLTAYGSWPFISVNECTTPCKLACVQKLKCSTFSLL